MPAHNFMISDCVAILVSFCLFSLVGFLPGFALGWFLDVLQFRSRTLWFRLAISVPLSISIGPILSYFVGRWLSMSAVLVLYALLCICALLLGARDLRSTLRVRPRPSRQQLQLFAIFAGWIIIAVLSLTDMQVGRRLYFSVIGLDYSVRTAFTNAISTSGLPAHSPFFFPGHYVALRYHYFWLILPALVGQIGRSVVDARQAFIGGTIWCGLGLISVIALYLRFFSPKAAADISGRIVIAAALLGVTGLDILPTLLMLWAAHRGWVRGVSPSVEWWNNQVDGWLYTMLWEPHYLCALVACFTGFLILWEVPRGSRKARSMLAAITAGLAFATGVGAGIYVAFVFVIFLIFWTMVTVAKKWYRETATLILSGAVASALSIPFLASLRGPGSGGSLFQLTVRSFALGELLPRMLGFNRPWQILVSDALLLPLNYFLELGLFFVVGRLAWKGFRAEKRAATRQELAAFMMISTSVAVCTFLKSGVISNNDLGWRGFLVAQFMLLIWTADLFSTQRGSMSAFLPISRAQKVFLTVLMILGVTGVAYDLTILRFFPLLSDAGTVPTIPWLASDKNLGERTYANREAYEWLRARTLAQAVIQQNPAVIYQDTFYGLYANRQTMAEDETCATVFGGDPIECAPVVKRLNLLFSKSATSVLPALKTACESLPIDIVVAKETDGVWSDRTSWVWTSTPMFANNYVRLFPCRK
jgi:hypothetical protein